VLNSNSSLKYFIFSYGKGIQKLKKEANLIGMNCKIEINGINYTNKQEKRSIFFDVNHYVKDCYSNIDTKGIYNSTKEGSIIGKINVKKNCINTKAFFHSDNLITMPDSKVNIRPILKIYNNDVACNHGATIGYLGKEEMFYLQSRGIDIKDAEQMLKHSFIKPSIDLIKVAFIKTEVKKVLGLSGIYI
jgi:Fe-S cluster assembly scaffold protein SufB